MALLEARQTGVTGLGSMVGWTVLSAVSAAIIGAYPTWASAGPAGIAAELVAAGAAVLPLIIGATVVLRAARGGSAKAALTFTVVGLVAGMTAVVAAVVLVRLADLPLAPLLIWIGIFYFVGIMTEGIWLSRQLVRGAYDLDRRPEATDSQPGKC